MFSPCYHLNSDAAHPHSVQRETGSDCALCNGRTRRELLGRCLFEPRLGGYLRMHRTDPYTNRILSLLPDTPYSSPSTSLMDIVHMFIIANCGEFVKSFRYKIFGGSIAII